jgi:hypothetical protein
VCSGGSAGSGAGGSSSGIAGVFFGVLRGLGTLASSLPARPLERGYLLLLKACTPPSRALPQPPPPPQPWPPSGVHLHRSDPPFGRSCIVSALSVCPVCRPREAPPAADAAARAAGRAAKAAGSMAAAWAAAETAAWPFGWPVAGLSDGCRKQPPSSSSSSSRGGYGHKRAPMAAWEAVARRTQPGSRGRRPEASPGGVRSAWERSPDDGSMRAIPHEKKWDRVHVGFS